MPGATGSMFSAAREGGPDEHEELRAVVLSSRALRSTGRQSAVRVGLGDGS